TARFTMITTAKIMPPSPRPSHRRRNHAPARKTKADRQKWITSGHSEFGGLSLLRGPRLVGHRPSVCGSLDERVTFGREFHQDGSTAGACWCSFDEAVAFGSGNAL
ncbi:hypothetical protein AB0D10_46095, partial [Kitasatospora sp. NPDC048545]|uniref:hypothetical protein n=1 Tax=Kitasatospora sp. NPDC048545 TaxID=3157208 RepID=UPI0033D630B6